MRQRIESTLADLRARPEDERVAAAFLGALAIAGVVFLVWAGFFFYNLRNGGREVVRPLLNNEAQQIVNTVQSVLEEQTPAPELLEESSIELIEVRTVDDSANIQPESAVEQRQ